ncbi:MAG: hypothetical protein JWO47_158 [Candidatus Saccharibacteria bacterium]|nr:hypothetical protein [Candidatus Saccharibacteria bacterium]
MSVEGERLDTDDAQYMDELRRIAGQPDPADVAERALVSIEDGKPVDIEAWREIGRLADAHLAPIPIEESARAIGEVIAELPGLTRPGVHVTLGDLPEAPADPNIRIER